MIALLGNIAATAHPRLHWQFRRLRPEDVRVAVLSQLFDYLLRCNKALTSAQQSFCRVLASIFLIFIGFPSAIDTSATSS
jgi:hypothetical protein